jgi:putative ABC transport system substrate-binding protein
MNLAADDPEGQTRIAAFRQELQQLGWTDGRDVRIDYRWAGAPLLALGPDVTLAWPPQAFKHCNS